jgi:hypothetical protein
MNEANKVDKPQENGVLPVSGSFISDVEKLTNDILKYFPKFFDDFTNYEYGTGVDAGKDFKKIFNKAKKLNRTSNNLVTKRKLCPTCGCESVKITL